MWDVFKVAIVNAVKLAAVKIAVSWQFCQRWLMAIGEALRMHIHYAWYFVVHKLAALADPLVCKTIALIPDDWSATLIQLSIYFIKFKNFLNMWFPLTETVKIVKVCILIYLALTVMRWVKRLIPFWGH